MIDSDVIKPQRFTHVSDVLVKLTDSTSVPVESVAWYGLSRYWTLLLDEVVTACDVVEDDDVATALHGDVGTVLHTDARREV